MNVAPTLTDIFGQRLGGNPAAGFRTTGYAPLVEHEYGRMTVERAPFRTLAVKYVNVDTLAVTIAPVPARLIPAMLQYNRWNQDDSALAAVLKGATTTRVRVTGPRDRVRIFGVKLPLYNMQRPSAPILQLVKVTSPTLSEDWQASQPYAIVQVTDLAVHAKIGYIHRRSGEPVTAGETLFTLHTETPERLPSALAELEGGWSVSDVPPPSRPLVIDRIV